LYYPSVISILGHRGYGKTYLCSKILRSIPVKAIVLDLRNQYNFKGFIYCDTVLDCIKKFLVADKGIFVLKPNSDYELNYFYKLLPLLGDGKNFKIWEGCIIVIDEMALVSNQKGFFNQELYNIIHYGRHKNIGFIGCSQRPVNIAPSLLSQSDVYISFWLSSFNDLKMVQGLIDKDLSKLERYKYYSNPIDINIENLFERD